MLKTASKVRRSRQAAASFDVEIAGVATAVPAHRLSQNDAASRAKDLFPQLAGHGRLFRNTGIKTRYACEPPGVVRRRAWLGGANRNLPAPCAAPARGGRPRRHRCCRHRAQGHQGHRRQYHHGPGHPEPRCQAHEPARSTSFGGAAADLRARLRRRRRRIGKGRRGWR